MPVARFEMPDGRIGRFEVPEGTTPEQAQEMIQQELIAQTQSDPATPAPASERFVSGLADPIHGGAQLLTQILPKGVVDAGNRFNNFIADKTGLVARLPEGGVDQQVRERAANYVAPEGIDWARLGGNILSPANLAVASKIPAIANLGGRVAAGVGMGAGISGLAPVESGDYWDTKKKQMAIGGAAGGVFPLVTGGVSRMVSPKASLNPDVKLLRKEGVTPTFGQTLGGAWNRAEEKLASVPLVGDMVSRARNNANNQFERAAFNRVLAPINQKLPNGLSGNNAVAHVETTLANNYDDVLNRIGAVKVDSQFNSKVRNLQNMVAKTNMPADKKMELNAIIDSINQSANKQGFMTSESYKTLESLLSTQSRNLGGSKNIFDNKLAPAVRQVKEELSEMLQRQAGPLAKELKQTNQAWAMFKRVQDASSKVGTDKGSFTPSQLNSSVRNLDKTKNKAAFARGNALMQDMSGAGKSVLGDRVPNSGTADRALMAGAGILSYLNPQVGIPLLAGSMAYTGPVQKSLNYLAASRPQFAQPAASAIKQSYPYLAPVSAGLLQQE